MGDIVERHTQPMSHDDVMRMKEGVTRRWDDKPHYTGDLSPGCMVRASELLSLIAAYEVACRERSEARNNALEEAARYHEDMVTKIRTDPYSYKNGSMLTTSKRASNIHEYSAAAVRKLKET